MDPQSVRGFLSAEEGETLARLARVYASRGALVEIGAYCGRSTLYLGQAARDLGALVFSVDHHRGSEEHQPGQEWHDPELWDDVAGAVDTLTPFRRAIRAAELEDVVVAMVGRSAAIGKAWGRPVGLLFLDGGHALKTALEDWRAWAGHIAPGGLLAIHDVFPNPSQGGRPPFEVHQLALASGLFSPCGALGALHWLERVG